MSDMSDINGVNGVNRSRSILTAVAGNWASRLYLAACAVLLVWVVVDSSFVTHEDASFAAVVPVLFTAPTSFAVILLPESTVFGYFAVVAAAALINSALIGLFINLVNRRPAQPLSV